jgi:predicted HAD superfamily Cof-like phosphohydrolase
MRDTHFKISGALNDVRIFHETFEHPVPDEPTSISQDRADTRGGWVIDEGFELIDDTATVLQEIAAGTSDDADLIAVQVDASMDQIYFGLGTVVELGLDLEPLWKIVHNANMAKRHMIDGKLTVVKNEAGKTVKPEGWEDPHEKIVAEVRRQMARAAVRLAA